MFGVRISRWYPGRALTLVASVGVGSLALSGCGAESAGQRDGYEIANQIVARDIASGGSGIDSDAPLELADADCSAEVTVDEYGFEQEQVTCSGDDNTMEADRTGDRSGDGENDADPATPTAADLLAAPGWLEIGHYPALVRTLPDVELAAAMTTLGSKLDRLEATCGVSEPAWVAALDEYIAAAEATRDLAAPERLGPYQGSVEAKALSRSVVERVLMESGCARPEPVPVGNDQDVLSRTSRAVEATVGIDNALRGSTYGPLFHLYSTLPNYLWMRNEQTAIDTVFLGTSQLGAAVDLAEVNREMTTEVGSAWLPGGLAEVQALWVDEVIRYSNPSTFVWFIGPLDLFVECDTTTRGAEFQRLADARLATFARGFVASDDPLDRILGSRKPEPTVRGDGIKREGLDAEGIAAHRRQYIPAFAEGRFCHDRAQIVAETIARLQADGRNVLVVGMPVHPELRAVRPGAAGEMEMFDEQYLGGTDLVDLTETVADSGLWSDLTHLTVEGAETFTEIVVAELRRAGLR